MAPALPFGHDGASSPPCDRCDMSFRPGTGGTYPARRQAPGPARPRNRGDLLFCPGTDGTCFSVPPRRGIASPSRSQEDLPLRPGAEDTRLSEPESAGPILSFQQRRTRLPPHIRENVPFISRWAGPYPPQEKDVVGFGHRPISFSPVRTISLPPLARETEVRSCSPMRMSRTMHRPKRQKSAVRIGVSLR